MLSLKLLHLSLSANFVRKYLWVKPGVEIEHTIIHLSVKIAKFDKYNMSFMLNNAGVAIYFHVWNIWLYNALNHLHYSSPTMSIRCNLIIPSILCFVAVEGRS